MNAHQLSVFRKNIEDEMNVLEQGAPTIRTKLSNASEVQPPASRDCLDHAKDETDLSLTLKLSNRDCSRYQSLKTALVRVTTGTYGRCETCSGDIAPRRLTVSPDARSCAQCQANEEYAFKTAFHPTAHYRSPPVPHIFDFSLTRQQQDADQ